MSTSKATPCVKHALLEKLHREIVPEPEQLIHELPGQLLDFRQAETRLRQGMLKLAQRLLEKWTPENPPQPGSRTLHEASVESALLNLPFSTCAGSHKLEDGPQNGILAKGRGHDQGPSKKSLHADRTWCSVTRRLMDVRARAPSEGEQWPPRWRSGSDILDPSFHE
jgi:hypothetical protein